MILYAITQHLGPSCNKDFDNLKWFKLWKVLLATVTEMTIWSYFVYHITALRNRKQPGNQMYGWIDPQTRYFLLTVNFGIGTLPLFFQSTATSIAPLYWEWANNTYNWLHKILFIGISISCNCVACFIVSYNTFHMQ